MAISISASALSEIFDRCFFTSENTRMVTGADEPYFVPANIESAFSDETVIEACHYARVFSRSDYASSVLHEAAHWCIAGVQRRQQLDYGYWYEPDGRTEEQQRLFESVEVKPQALEWIMSVASGVRFRVSADNANDPSIKPSQQFLDAIYSQALQYLKEGLPDRAQRFVEMLDGEYELDKRYTKLSSYVRADLV